MSAVGPKSPLPTLTSQSPQDFYQNIYTLLETGQPTSAFEALKQGQATQTSLAGRKVMEITDYLSKEFLTDFARAGKLVRLIKSKPKTFVGVNTDLFTSSIPEGHSFAAKTKNSETNDTSSQMFEFVKTLGKQAGLSDQEVSDALEEIVAEDGSSTWMVKVFHFPKYIAWQDSLMMLASQEQIILFCEGAHKEATGAMNVNRGFFRGFESDASGLQLATVESYPYLFGMLQAGNIDQDKFKKAAGIMLAYLTEPSYKEDTYQALLKIAPKSNTAKSLLQKAFLLESDPPLQNTYEYLGNLMIEEIPYLQEWISFYELLLPVVYKNADKKILAAIEKMVALGRQVNKSSNERTYDLLVQQHLASVNNLLMVIGKHRDQEYASVYYSERPRMPKEQLAFVTFGANHAPRFKTALFGLQKIKHEGKYNDKGDEKASVAQTAQKASGKTESSSNTKTG